MDHEGTNRAVLPNGKVVRLCDNHLAIYEQAAEKRREVKERADKLDDQGRGLP